MIGKITTNFVIHDYKEQQILLLDSIDLQSINFISKLLKVIDKYKSDNKIITKKCHNFINYIYNKFTNKIPYNKDKIKLELLKKILPFGMDTNYINFDDKSIQQDMICILFTDIVSYTELAKLYDDKTIFNLLNNIYHTFDIIIKKYNYLQKIETIGDAYMVVGDIYRNCNNYKLAAKEIMLLAIEFIKEIKNIKTPDNNELSIRIGINIGPVSIGILGSEIPRLCIVGNTVNTAARLQSTADIDTIQISSSLYEILEEISPSIIFDKKENVFLKSIGSVDTYNYKAL
jgi:class 3 adenylate cyclase